MEIVNYYIKNTNFNLDTERTIQDIEKWYIDNTNKNLPIIVCILEGNVAGFASLSSFRLYKGYSKTAELSIYVDKAYQKRGIASALLKQIELKAKEIGIHAIVSVISFKNEPSINLHKKFNYQFKAIFEEIGYKNDEFLDVVFYYKIL